MFSFFLQNERNLAKASIQAVDNNDDGCEDDGTNDCEGRSVAVAAATFIALKTRNEVTGDRPWQALIQRKAKYIKILLIFFIFCCAMPFSFLLLSAIFSVFYVLCLQKIKRYFLIFSCVLFYFIYSNHV